MTSLKKLIIIKRPRKDPIKDVPINFPPLFDLRLDMMEVKKKLKAKLPLIQYKPLIQKTKIAPIVKAELPKLDISHEDDSELNEEDLKASSLNKDIEIKPKDPSTKISTPKIKDTSSDKHASNEEGPPIIDEHPEAETGGNEEEVLQEPEDPDAHLSPEEKEAKDKEEYMWRYKILKKQYKNVPIPEFNEFTDLQTIKLNYNRTIKELYLDDSVDTYRQYLIGSFIVIEFVATQWIGIDFTGFSKHQTMMMYKYDRMLIELGEKSHNSFVMNLPVELRLLGVILLNAGIFYLGKILSDKVGGSVGDLFKGFFGGSSSTSSSSNDSSKSTSGEPPKKKMRGPSKSAADIKKMNKDSTSEKPKEDIKIEVIEDD